VQDLSRRFRDIQQKLSDQKQKLKSEKNLNEMKLLVENPGASGARR
jgi:hypothetical protein